MERWITASTTIDVPFELASPIVTTATSRLLPDGRAEPSGRLITALSVETKGGAAVRHDVAVTLGAPHSAEGETWVPIEWEPIAHTALLPTFVGVLELVEAVDGVELAITGIYGVPLGVVGRFGDGLIGRRVAQQSISSLLGAMAAQLLSEVADEFAQTSWKPAPYPISLRERPVPELPSPNGSASSAQNDGRESLRSARRAP